MKIEIVFASENRKTLFYFEVTITKVMGLIPTVGAFLTFPLKTTSTGSRPRKRTGECFNKPEASDTIKL